MIVQRDGDSWFSSGHFGFRLSASLRSLVHHFLQVKLILFKYLFIQLSSGDKSQEIKGNREKRFCMARMQSRVFELLSRIPTPHIHTCLVYMGLAAHTPLLLETV